MLNALQNLSRSRNGMKVNRGFTPIQNTQIQWIEMRRSIFYNGFH